ncbi:MAG: efflux RND transporter periplasmic adaptor subunit [Blastocatellia bacterium]
MNEKALSSDRVRRTTWVVVAALVVFVAGLLLWRFLLLSQKAEPSAASADDKASVTEESKPPANRVRLSAESIARGGIEIGEATMQAFRQTLEAPGRLALNEDTAARVGTFVEGRVTRVLVTVGDRVKKGQALVYVHSHELLDARADEAKARAAVTEKEKALAYANAELERAERLLEAKAVSKREREQAAANVVAATAQLEQARAELSRVSEWLEHLTVPHDSHDDVVIYSPISGVALKRLITLGTVVSENSDLMLIGNLDTLWAVAEAPEAQAAFIRIGAPIEMTVLAFGDARFAGRVVHIGETLDPDTRTAQVRCLINNPNGKLRPEMYAKIVISGGSSQQVIAAPRDAVQEVQGERVVFLAVGDGVFEKKVAQTGREQNGLIEITGGLQAGQRVVTRGGFFLKSEFLKGTMSKE